MSKTVRGLMARIIVNNDFNGEQHIQEYFTTDYFAAKDWLEGAVAVARNEAKDILLPIDTEICECEFEYKGERIDASSLAGDELYNVLMRQCVDFERDRDHGRELFFERINGPLVRFSKDWTRDALMDCIKNDLESVFGADSPEEVNAALARFTQLSDNDLYSRFLEIEYVIDGSYDQIDIDLRKYAGNVDDVLAELDEEDE